MRLIKSIDSTKATDSGKEVVSCLSCFQKCWRASISFMSLANSKSIINQEVVEQLTRNKPLSDEQYELSSTRSTADVLIPRKISCNSHIFILWYVRQPSLTPHLSCIKSYLRLLDRLSIIHYHVGGMILHYSYLFS